MCGVAGFFVGCQLADTCPFGNKACSLVKNKNVLKEWHEKASVRNAPRRMLNEDDLSSHVYPQNLAPVTNHDLVINSSGERINKILTNHLYRYLDFTTKLEVVAVNDTVKDLALGHSVINPSEEMKIDALKIYTDEAYHALFSADLFAQLKSMTGIHPVVPKVPYFLSTLNKIISEYADESEKNLMKLIFVIVSETLITSSLTDIRKDSSLPEAVRDVIRDHAMDEARHHAFFSGLLMAIWPMLDRRTRIHCLTRIPDFIFAFVHPDKDAITAELCSVGFSLSDADIIVNETYTQPMIESYARGTSSRFMGHVMNFDEFHESEVQDAFEKKGLIQQVHEFESLVA